MFFGLFEEEIVETRVGNGSFFGLDRVSIRADAAQFHFGADHQAGILAGHVDQIIVTGGIAYNVRITDKISEYVSFIAPVTVYPGEAELLALAQGAIRVMNGEEEAKIY